ncbi:MAG: glycosyltransferase family protein, partial [Steroidobacteraceae bacterium]
AGACLITDEWPGIGSFLEPGSEVLVARDGEEVAAIAGELTPARAERLGRAALRRVLAEHTYAHRALEVERILAGIPANGDSRTRISQGPGAEAAA